jgi:hypothetical protein
MASEQKVNRDRNFGHLQRLLLTLNDYCFRIARRVPRCEVNLERVVFMSRRGGPLLTLKLSRSVIHFVNASFPCQW